MDYLLYHDYDTSDRSIHEYYMNSTGIITSFALRIVNRIFCCAYLCAFDAYPQGMSHSILYQDLCI